MCDSSKDQAYKFSERECLDMLKKNIKLDVSLKLSLSVDKITKRNLLKEPEQLMEDNIDVDSNDDRVQANLENNQSLQENIRKRQLTSSLMKNFLKKKSTQWKTQMIAETKDSAKKNRFYDSTTCCI